MGAPTILIVDDYADARDLMAMIFEHAGFVVVTAVDGAAALRVAAAQPPDVVLMDILMPRMDGIEATRLLKNDSSFAGVPVIAYTANPAPLKHASELFAAICVKPCPPDEVVRVALTLVRRCSDV